MSYIHEFLFGLYPYLAGSVFLIGSLLRFDRDQYTWKADSSQILRKKNFRLASNLFHVGIILLFFGHLFGMLTPPAVYHVFVSTSGKQILSMVAGGVFGLMCLVGLTMLIHRRWTDPRVRANTTRMDFFILFLLYIQLILGLFTIPVSMFHLDGANMLLMTNWAQHIVTFRGDAAQFLVEVPFLYKLHIVLGLTLFLVFPFSRLVHIWSAPVWYLGRQGYQIVRQR